MISVLTLKETRHYDITRRACYKSEIVGERFGVDSRTRGDVWDVYDVIACCSQSTSGDVVVIPSPRHQGKRDKERRRSTVRHDGTAVGDTRPGAADQRRRRGSAFPPPSGLVRYQRQRCVRRRHQVVRKVAED